MYKSLPLTDYCCHQHGELISKPIHYNLFENRVPVHFSYRYSIFKWFTEIWQWWEGIGIVALHMATRWHAHYMVVQTYSRHVNSWVPSPTLTITEICNAICVRLCNHSRYNPRYARIVTIWYICGTTISALFFMVYAKGILILLFLVILNCYTYPLHLENI